MANQIFAKSKCPFGYTSGAKPDAEGSLELNDEPAHYPSQVLTCPKDGKVLQTQSFTGAQYEELAKQIIEQQFGSEDRTKYAACLLRLEGHDLMDFRRDKNKKGGFIVDGPGTGGSDGCVNFLDADNTGLEGCLRWTGIESIYSEWCDKISLADFMVLAAEAVVGSIAVDYEEQDPFEEGTLLGNFKSQFQFGRKTVE